MLMLNSVKDYNCVLSFVQACATLQSPSTVATGCVCMSIASTVVTSPRQGEWRWRGHSCWRVVGEDEVMCRHLC